MALVLIFVGDAVGDLAQGDFPQQLQILPREEVVHRGFGALGAVDLSLLEAAQQLVRLDVDEPHFVRAVKEGIRNGLLHLDLGDVLHHVVETLQVLHVHGGVHVDPGGKQLLHILKALFIAHARGIRVRQFVDQDELGVPLDRLVQVELLKLDVPVRDHLGRKLGSPSRRCIVSGRVWGSI